MAFPQDIPCPSCQQQMEKGYVVSMNGMNWSPDEKTGRFIIPTMKTDVLYPENEGEFANARYLAARCPKCSILFLQYKS
ncbi:MAG TPA: PF20097 family protein [Blastocatellia bacterium]|nr:PF20097 family protein [Blastocatellia bacterium]